MARNAYTTVHVLLKIFDRPPPISSSCTGSFKMYVAYRVEVTSFLSLLGVMNFYIVSKKIKVDSEYRKTVLYDRFSPVAWYAPDSLPILRRHDKQNSALRHSQRIEVLVQGMNLTSFFCDFVPLTARCHEFSHCFKKDKSGFRIPKDSSVRPFQSRGLVCPRLASHFASSRPTKFSASP